jgi:signal transduction histidine kinase
LINAIMNYNKPRSIVPANEQNRLEKLRDYQIVDTHSEDTFDKIALMASQIFGTPSSFITFVDDDKVFLKSNLSQLPFTEVDRAASLCSLVILSDEITVFNDTHTVDYLMDNSFIALDGGMRFFAGAPLKSPEGYNVGAICVGDSQPREVSNEQLDMLKTLASIVIDKLENRLRYRKTVESQVNLMNIALHEIKNPLASINLANDILKKDISAKDKMTDMIRSSVKRIQSKLADLLMQSELEEKELTLSIEEVDMKELFCRVLNNFELLAKRKKQVIELKCDELLPIIQADKAKLTDILHNLVSNAIKYSYYGTTIHIIAQEANGCVQIEVKDEGQGLSEHDVDKLFTKFAKLSSKPTGKETSNGLGLSITKSLVELHHGTIEAISEGKDKGTSFIITLPIEYNKEQLQEEFN